MMQKKKYVRRFELPPKGLIVSCYLESMSGAEYHFINSVYNIDDVVALRVEGVEYIEYAKGITRKPIIGLIKNQQSDGSYITATLKDLRAVEEAGADMVAVDSRRCNQRKLDIYSAASVPIMADIETGDEAIAAYKLGAEIIATTFQRKAFELLLLSRIIDCPFNLEGGIETREEIKKGFDLGAFYVTIGKMINDPPTIIDYFINDKSISQ